MYIFKEDNSTIIALATYLVLRGVDGFLLGFLLTLLGFAIGLVIGLLMICFSRPTGLRRPYELVPTG